MCVCKNVALDLTKISYLRKKKRCGKIYYNRYISSLTLIHFINDLFQSHQIILMNTINTRYTQVYKE